MKKNLLFVGLLLALSLGVSAQKTGFGFKLGPSFNWVGSKNSEAANLKLKTGFNFGLDAEFYMAENIAIVTGLNVNLINGSYRFADKREMDTLNGYVLGTVDRNFKTEDELRIEADIGDGVQVLIERMTKFLSDKEVRVVKGILRGKTQTDISGEMKLSKVRISQLQASAFSKIRSSPMAGYLRRLLK